MKLDEMLRIFRVFSDRNRLQIYLALLEAELCVREIMKLLKIEQSLLSHQLRILRQAGLVVARRNGRWFFYSLSMDYRRQLEPLLRNMLGEEIEMAARKVKSIKNKRDGGIRKEEERSSVRKLSGRRKEISRGIKT